MGNKLLGLGAKFTSNTTFLTTNACKRYYNDSWNILMMKLQDEILEGRTVKLSVFNFFVKLLQNEGFSFEYY